jgi:hypothetical protein
VCVLYVITKVQIYFLFVAKRSTHFGIIRVYQLTMHLHSPPFRRIIDSAWYMLTNVQVVNINVTLNILGKKLHFYEFN